MHASLHEETRRSPARRRPRSRTISTAVAAGALVLALSACSSGAGTSASSSNAASPAAPQRTVDLGGPQPVQVGGTPLKIALLTPMTSNAWGKEGVAAAVGRAKELGVDLTVFDAGLDPTKQLQQARTVVAGKNYNAIAMAPLTPEMCSVVQDAIKAGMLVSIFNQPVCKPSTSYGDSAYYPGTVSWIGGDQGPDVYTAWLQRIATDNPGHQKVILLGGIPSVAQWQFQKDALPAAKQINPDMDIVMAAVPTVDTPGANKVTQALLTANPDTTVIASQFSDMTQGALLAIKAAGRSNIKVYDSGGTKWAFGAVTSGALQLTTPLLPRTQYVTALDTLYSTWYKGDPGPHYVDVLKVKGLSSPLLAKDNISGISAEY